MLPLLCACGTEWHLKRGESAIHAMELPEAERSFRRALAKEPDNIDALYGLGWTYHLAGFHSEARETFERCIQVRPESALGYKGLGSQALAEGNLDVARARFEQALERAPAEPAVRNSLALLELRSGNHQQALELYEALLGEQPDLLELTIGKAEALSRLGRPEEALAVVDRALTSASPSDRQATLLHTLRARILHAHTTGRLDDERCEETAPPLLRWLEEADAALDRAVSYELELESLNGVRREIHQRRKLIQRQCPGSRSSG
jgi:tetratricopeptide (TPR) repeat protein